MKKIVFVPVPMQELKSKEVYKFDGNAKLEYGKGTFIAVNGILAKILRKDDDVKIVRIVTKDKGDFSLKNAELQRSELEELNKDIGARIEYTEIMTPFEENAETLEVRFRELLGTLEEKAEIIFDMTFGPKTLVPVLFYVLGFAEKFFDADIKHILYSKIDFDKKMKQPIPGTGVIYDMTSLFYLNSLASVMDAPDGKTALARLDKFFAI